MVRNSDTDELDYLNTARIICGWKDVVIPDEVSNDKVKVTSIREYAFTNNKSISSIKVNPSCTSIGYNSFKNVLNNLQTVDVSENDTFIKDEENNLITSSKNKRILFTSGNVTIADVYVQDNINVNRFFLLVDLLILQVLHLTLIK